MRRCLLICAVLTAAAASAEKQPFDRYQSIVDRQMFGPLPPGFDPTKNPSEVQKSSASEKELTQEQAKLQSAIHFSVINVTPDGETAVGFSDNSDPKSPVRYYLKVGEKRDGWEVKEADAAEARMTIAKGEVEVTLTLGGDSSKTEGATTKAGGAASRRPAFSGRSSLFGGGSLAARRQQRRRQQEEEQAQANAAAEAKEAERQAQAEVEKQQREAERAEQRQQLLAIQEELKKVREAKASAKAEESSGTEGDENN